jgi:hypothetical protein
MPTVLRFGAYRFFFYAGDGDEPEHIHVARDNLLVKFWLNPLRLARSGGFRPAEIRRIQGIAADHREMMLETWNEYFGD